jgi:D-methionine transport system ATP-binding protein
MSRFYQRPLLHNLSFSVNQGERLGIFGAAGAGKTLLLRVLNRLIESQQGAIAFRGKSLKSYPVVTLRQQVLFVSERPSLLDMTVAQALQHPLMLRGVDLAESQTRIAAVCERTQIPQDWLSQSEINLSTAQRQWVSLARALLIDPPVLLLDAPFTYLNESYIERFSALLQHFAGTVLITSQIPRELRAICDRVLWLETGEIRQLSTVEQIDWEKLPVHPPTDPSEDW